MRNQVPLSTAPELFPPNSSSTTIVEGIVIHVRSVPGFRYGVDRIEYKIDFGPGYRIYFGRDGDRLVILIGGGTKKRQQQDIAAAQECWAAYKRRKRQEIQ